MGEDDLSDRGKGRDGGMKEQATQLDGCRRGRGGRGRGSDALLCESGSHEMSLRKTLWLRACVPVCVCE